MLKQIVGVSVVLLLLGACSSPNVKKGDADMAKAIDCKTAEGDIRALNAEKAHTSQEIAAGVTSIVPIGAVAHLVQGKEGDSLKVGTGEYNEALDKKIAQIKSTCGIK
ncbi:MAG: hypothetical protein CME59_07265 [Halioglobus sp.]|nr:hypothetical protein [Halioglobus sp.]|tara:strand:+ start:1650 stop:1973 length:324 start_codon:yes stop_codon:yes gene_type:complete